MLYFGVPFELVIFLFVCLFFFKQKTAYEMRISDWSSDVCSSDLFGCDDVIDVAPFLCPHVAEQIGTDGPRSGLHLIPIFFVQLAARIAVQFVIKRLYLLPSPVRQSGKLIGGHVVLRTRVEEITSELQSIMRKSYAFFCLKQKKTNKS